MKLKRHRWSPVIRESVIYKHQSCVRCHLQKASFVKDHNIETYYFEFDNEKMEITRFGRQTNRVPYGCGDVVPLILEDDLFEI